MAPDRNVLVWGGLGFIGHHLVSRLLSEGFNVSVLTRSRSLYPVPSWATRVQWFELPEGGDNQAVLREAVAGATVIYDFAGASGAVASNRDPLFSLDANCRSQLEFLCACEMAAHRPHIVYPSSWLVYEGAGDGPTNENDRTAPLSMYAAHKLCIENYLKIMSRRERITHTICRISNPYGHDSSRPGKGYKVLNSFLEQALHGISVCIFGDGGQLRDFIYISDLVEALLLCGYSPAARNELFNVSSGKSYSLHEAVEIIRDLVGGPAPLFGPWPDEYKAVEPGDYVADVSKIRTKLGFNAVYDLPAGLEHALSSRGSIPGLRREQVASA